MSSAEPKRFQCRHIFTEGRRCGSPCLRGEPFCFYHHTSRPPVAAPAKRRARRGAFHLPFPEDRAAIQLSIGEILRRIAAGELDTRRAGLLLYGLQIAQTNLPRNLASSTPAAAAGKKRTLSQPQSQPHVEEILVDPQHGLLAPPAEFGKATAEKNLYDILMEQWEADREQDEEEAGEASKPLILDTHPGAPPFVGSTDKGWGADCGSSRTLDTLQASASPNCRYTSKSRPNFRQIKTLNHKPGGGGSAQVPRCRLLGSYPASSLPSRHARVGSSSGSGTP